MFCFCPAKKTIEQCVIREYGRQSATRCKSKWKIHPLCRGEHCSPDVKLNIVYDFRDRLAMSA